MRSNSDRWFRRTVLETLPAAVLVERFTADDPSEGASDESDEDNETRDTVYGVAVYGSE